MNAERNSLRLVNGATMNVATMSLVSVSNGLEVIDSTLNCSALEVNGNHVKVLLDNGKINVSGGIAYWGGPDDRCEILFKGPKAELKVKGGDRPGRVRTRDTFVFCVPEGGYETIPFHKDDSSTDGTMFNDYSDNKYPRTFTIAEDSPIFRGGRRAIIPLVFCKTGIANTATVEGVPSNLELLIPASRATVRGIPCRIFFVDAQGNELTTQQVESGAQPYGISADLGGFGGTRTHVR